MVEQTVQDEATDSAAQDTAHGTHDRGLLLIGLFKLTKSVFFFCVGIGIIKMFHKELGNEAMRLMTAMRFDPEGKVVRLLLEKVDTIDQHRLREFSVLTFGYSALSLVEGVGLMMEKVWAEYLTLGLTISFLPWEIFELIRGFGWGKVAVLLFNLIILAYILWLLRRKRAATAPHAVAG